MTTEELLQRYAADRSETAFAELVRHHMDLVYSAALRQVNGDVPAAEDIAQAVFTDLARKAPRLRGHTSLAGWLYTSTRYLATKTRRADLRRRAREQEALAMKQLLEQPESEGIWEDLRPLLDDAMHDLKSSDREAVLMRYFEHRSLAEIGARLGLSENTARMRVDRAVDKLRDALAKRGAIATVAVLAGLLAARAVAASPAGLSARISQTALTASAIGGFSLLTWLSSGTAKLTAAVLTATVVGLVVVPHLTNQGEKITAVTARLAPDSPAIPAAREAAVSSTPANAAIAPVETDSLILRIVTADSNQPISGVVVACSMLEAGADRPQRTELRTGATGECVIPLHRDRLRTLTLDSKVDGFADRRLEWSVASLRETIPTEYLLRLPRATPIGGMIVDAEGHGIAGAEVTCQKLENTGEETRPENRIGEETIVTDAQGRWHVDRFDRESIPTLRVGMVTHSGYVMTFTANLVGSGTQRERDLLSSNDVITLNQSLDLRGVIVDTNGGAVAGAKITTTGLILNTNSQTDGTFLVPDHPAGHNSILVEAPGFAVAMFDVNLTNSLDSAKLTLSPGKTLRLRVLDSAGNPVAKAMVSVNLADVGIPSLPGLRRTDADGRWVWTSAPTDTVTIPVEAPGSQRAEHFNVKADGEEHTLTLNPAPALPAATFSGTVRDAATGQPIQRFLVVIGHVRPDTYTGVVGAHWDASQTFLTPGGTFRYTDDTTNRQIQFKFAAEGHAAFITDIYDAHGQPGRLDISLPPATPKRISILAPDGQPEPGAGVGFVSPGASLLLGTNGLRMVQNTTRKYVVGGEYRMETMAADAQGGFLLPPDASILRVMAVGRDGFTEVTPAELATGQNLRLQPWGRIEGTVLSDSDVPVGRTVMLIADNSTDFRLEQNAYRVQPDARGHFTFTNVPPAHLEIRLDESMTTPGAPPSTRIVSPVFAPLAYVDLQAGEIKTVTAGTHTAVLHPRWPADLNRQTNWNSRAFLTTITQPPGGVRTMHAEWPLTENLDGSFTANDLPAGTYDGSIYFSEPTAPDHSGPVRARARFSVTLPSDPLTGPVDLGEVPIQPAP